MSVSKVVGIDTPYEIDKLAYDYLKKDIKNMLVESFHEAHGGAERATTASRKSFRSKVVFREPYIQVISTTFGGGLYSITPWTMFLGSQNIQIYPFSRYLSEVAEIKEQSKMKNMGNIDPMQLYLAYRDNISAMRYKLLTTRNNDTAYNFYGNIYNYNPPKICWGDAVKTGGSPDAFYTSLFNGDLGSALRNKSEKYRKLSMDLSKSLEKNLEKAQAIPNSLYENIVSYIIISSVYEQLTVSKTKIMNFSFNYQTGVF